MAARTAADLDLLESSGYATRKRIRDAHVSKEKEFFSFFDDYSTLKLSMPRPAYTAVSDLLIDRKVHNN